MSSTLRENFSKPVDNCPTSRVDSWGTDEGADNVTLQTTKQLELQGRRIKRARKSFEFNVPLAREADFYTVEIAGREGPVYSQAEMETADWIVELSIG